MISADDLLRIALDVGEGLLKSGGEIRRVETTVEKICHAYSAAHVEVFSINSLIIASVRMPDGSYSSQTRRITDISNDMRCLERFNALSRDICAHTPAPSAVDSEIARIKSSRKYPLWASLLGNSLAAGGFAVIFGGSPRDALAAAVIGVAVGLIEHSGVLKFNRLSKTLVLSFISGMLTCLSVMIGIGQSMDMIAIGTIMLLIPGLSLSNAMRDLLRDDTLTGTLKTVQACITAIMIAAGYGISIILLGRYCPPPDVFEPSAPIRTLLLCTSAFLGTVGFALMFKTALKRLWIAGLGGLAVYAVYELSLYMGAPVFAAAISAAFVIYLLAELCARIFKAPAILFFLCFSIPIVPGGSLYYSMYNLISYDAAAFTLHIQKTGQILLGMVLGICLCSVLLKLIEMAIDALTKKRK